jgi:hypothetical protein
LHTGLRCAVNCISVNWVSNWCCRPVFWFDRAVTFFNSSIGKFLIS